MTLRGIRVILRVIVKCPFSSGRNDDSRLKRFRHKKVRVRQTRAAEPGRDRDRILRIFCCP
jgi:hypothetical protein